MTKITDELELLNREAALASQVLGAGLTSLRKYNFAEKGYFYNGMFSITIGLERVLKLILIYDYRLSNTGKFPNDGYLKKMGHKIEDLVGWARSINQSQKLGVDESCFDDDLIAKVIKFLTDFAGKSRYYNLDTLSGTGQKANEPLARWDNEICTVILKRHFEMSLKKARMLGIGETIKDIASVHHSHEDGSIIDTTTDLAIQSVPIEDKQKYSLFYVYQLVRFVVKVFIELELRQKTETSLRDFFVLYHLSDKSQILRRRIWDPYRP